MRSPHRAAPVRFAALIALALGFGSVASAEIPPFRRHAIPVSRPRDLVIADFSGDGRADLVVSASTSSLGAAPVLMFRGLGDGGFAAPEAVCECPTGSSVSAADVNSDSRLDLVVGCLGGPVMPFLANGEGGFDPAPIVSVSTGAWTIQVADLNRDSHQDVVLGGGFGPIAILCGSGDGTFGAPAYFPFNPWYAEGARARSAISRDRDPGVMKEESLNEIALGDLNGDSHIDLGTAQSLNVNAGMVHVLLGDGHGGMRAGPYDLVDFVPTSIAMGDLNGDQLDDVVNNAESALRVWLSRGDSLGPVQLLGFVGFGSGVALGDIDLDGRLDLVTGSQPPVRLEIRRGLGDGTFEARRFFAAGAAPVSIAIGDLDGDGLPDIATGETYADLVSVHLTSGHPVMVESPDPPQLFLSPPFPNPATRDVALRLSLSQPGPATLRVIDATGRVVARLLDGVQNSGRHNFRWNRLDDRGAPVAAGIYFFVLEAGGRRLFQRLVVLR